MIVPIKTDRYFTCPNGCEDKFVVEHLFGPPLNRSGEHGNVRAGPWNCDTCGTGWAISIALSGEVDVTKSTSERANQKRCWVILEIPPQKEAIRLKVRGQYWSRCLDEETLGGLCYFYNEHTCPTNWLRDVEEIAIGEDTDPHGLAEFVAAYDIEHTETPLALAEKNQ